MTKELENKINNGEIPAGAETIQAVVHDLHNNGEVLDALSVEVVAGSLAQVDAQMIDGYEMDKGATLSNYFNPKVVQRWEIELLNSQLIYFSRFSNLIDGDFQEYIEALKATGEGNPSEQLRLDKLFTSTV